MRCGTMSGLLFDRSRLLESLRRAEELRPNSYYPQVWAGMALSNGRRCNSLSSNCRLGDSLLKAFADRGDDFLLGERFFWARTGRDAGVLRLGSFYRYLFNLAGTCVALERLLLAIGESVKCAKFRTAWRSASQQSLKSGEVYFVRVAAFLQRQRLFQEIATKLCGG